MSQPLLEGARRIGRIADATLRKKLGVLISDGDGGAAAGTPPEDRTAAALLPGAVAYVRSRLAQQAPADAVTLANSIAGPPYVSQLLNGLITFKNGDLETAWKLLAQVPSVAWATHIPAEATRCGLTCDRETMLRQMRDLTELGAVELPVHSWYRLTGAALGVSDRELARACYARLVEAAELSPKEWKDSARQVEWLRPWIEGHGRHPAGESHPGRVSLGVIAWDNPLRNVASQNLGDPVQSMASIGHLVRHDVTFHGDPDLVDTLNFFQQQVPEDLRRSDGSDVDVMVVDRDVSRWNDVPPNTWMLVVGWWMYPVFGLDYQLPLNDNINPIILSFYCRHPSFLTPQAVDYLKKNGPIGCRDWTTVHLLLKAGVPAFFSGCITSTVSTVFKRDRVIDRNETLHVEAPDTPEGAETAIQVDDAMRDQPAPEQLRRVHQMLDGYRHFRDVRTKRLHCYMPMRSLGVDVEFLPGNPADLRFPGLGGITQDEFVAMRDGINELVDPVMSAILRAEDEPTVRALWRELTAERVAEARRRFEAPVIAPAELPGDDDAIRRGREAIRTVWRGNDADRSDTITIATTINKQQLGAMQVLINSVMSRTRRPVDWLVIGTAVPMTSLNETSALGKLAAHYEHLTLRTVKSTEVPKPAMTLSLPDLLDADRIIQLTAESVVLGDISELADLSLDGKSAAAAVTPSAEIGSGLEELRNAATQLRDRDRAHELRRDALTRQPRDLRSLRNEVLVLNAARLRERRAGQLARRYAHHVQLSNRHQILLLVGADHTPLPPAWAVQSGPEEVTAASRFVYFVGSPKPWEPGIGYNAATWLAERDALRTVRSRKQ